MERFNLKKLNEAESTGQVEISIGFAALENLDDDVNISRVGVKTYYREYPNFSPRSVGYYELKKHKPWFDEGFSE
jgi:hypothetical protein